MIYICVKNLFIIIFLDPCHNNFPRRLFFSSRFLVSWLALKVQSPKCSSVHLRHLMLFVVSQTQSQFAQSMMTISISLSSPHVKLVVTTTQLVTQKDHANVPKCHAVKIKLVLMVGVSILKQPQCDSLLKLPENFSQKKNT